MARAAQSEEGKAGFLQHRDETEGQIERIEQVFELLGKSARGKTCEAIQHINAEEYKGSVALDAGLIGAACRALLVRALRHAHRPGQPA